VARIWSPVLTAAAPERGTVGGPPTSRMRPLEFRPRACTRTGCCCVPWMGGRGIVVGVCPRCRLSAASRPTALLVADVVPPPPPGPFNPLSDTAAAAGAPAHACRVPSPSCHSTVWCGRCFPVARYGPPCPRSGPPLRALYGRRRPYRNFLRAPFALSPPTVAQPLGAPPVPCPSPFLVAVLVASPVPVAALFMSPLSVAARALWHCRRLLVALVVARPSHDLVPPRCTLLPPFAAPRVLVASSLAVTAPSVWRQSVVRCCPGCLLLFLVAHGRGYPPVGSSPFIGASMVFSAERGCAHDVFDTFLGFVLQSAQFWTIRTGTHAVMCFRKCS